jgi:hypothetical protein
MCKTTLNIGWNGFMYDCDFSQQLDLKFTGKAKHINDFDFEEVLNLKIIINNRCYGFIFATGISCSGEIAYFFNRRGCNRTYISAWELSVVALKLY